jgi:hypothetical protein
MNNAILLLRLYCGCPLLFDQALIFCSSKSTAIFDGAYIAATAPEDIIMYTTGSERIIFLFQKSMIY